MSTGDKKTDGISPARSVPAPPPAEGSTGAKTPLTNASNPRGAAASHPDHTLRWLILGGIAVLVLAVVLTFGIPWLHKSLVTISTDDAYVNGYPSYVAPRVSGQVIKVLVIDNNQVKAGDLLVQLDPEPYQKEVNIKKATVVTARADLKVADDQAHALVATARSNRFKLEHAIEDVDNQVALLQTKVAALKAAKFRMNRAKADYLRAQDLRKNKPDAISQQDLDKFQQDFLVSEADVQVALATVYQIRVGLGLPAQPKKASLTKDWWVAWKPEGSASPETTDSVDDLTDVPDNLSQTYSSVRVALAELLQSAAPLGVFPESYDDLPKKVLADFLKRDKDGNIERIYKKILDEAPTIKQAQAKVDQAEADLAQANLNLSYCDIRASIDGLVTRRSVKEGDNVAVGQSLMAVRSVTEIWIDANFKETQLRELRIGQYVEVEVDMYGSHRTYEGRITGFTMGTGQTLALLPPQNATGNFVKIVQRLPVRIELTNYDPKTAPLFIGLSVEPHVYYKRPPEGPHAGEVLQPPISQ